MYDFGASAPGKLFLSGEYAVLEGAPAVICSVDRRVLATTTKRNLPQSALLRSVSSEVAEFLRERSGSPAGQLPNVEIDSSGFSSGRTKLGIGSSAAVSASTTGVLFRWAGLDMGEHLANILRVATDAHREYQGGKGSGADVATSVLGGTILFQKEEEPRSVPDMEMERVFVWSGKAASTVSFVDEVKRLKSGDPLSYSRSMTPLAELADELARLYMAGDVRGVIERMGAYGEAMGRLGVAARVPIVTEELERVALLAGECGGAAKPSGAGGGDVCVAVFETASQAEEFRRICGKEEVEVLELTAHVDGLGPVQL